jgi:uncharacterized membrane protein YjjP (DUF1212 family)
MDKTLTEQEIALLRRKLDLLLRTGQLLVESAADTNRVVRNLNRVAAYLGLPEEKLHIDVSYTMLVVNVSDGLHSFSKFQKCEKHGINMTAISEISKLSWRAIENDYSLDQYEEELERIKNKKRNYVPYVVAIGAGFACGGFCKLFGGDWMAFLFTSICAFAGFRVRARCMEFGINHYMSIAIAALISTCLAYVSSFAGLSETPYHPLLACALFIVPGVPLINFVDDMIDNYIQVGIVRAVNTVLMVCAMAFGIVIAMRLLTVEDVVIAKQFPLLMSALWIGSEKLKPNDTIASVINQGTLGIGFIGLAECLVALLGKHHGESGEAQELGLKIVTYMRDRANQFSEQYQHNYSVLATPAEGLSGKFTRIDRKKFGTLPGITDRDYYTNSNHVPVYYKCSARHKAEVEAPYHELTRGGHIFYVEIDGDATHNPEVIMRVVDMMDQYNIGYGSVNHNRNRCLECGHENSTPNLEECPKCGSKHIDKLQRITGYLVGTTDRWNNAKLAELNDRAVHN